MAAFLKKLNGQKAQEQAWMDLATDVRNQQSVRFVTENMHRKECTCFIPETNKRKDGAKVCGCGATKFEHDVINERVFTPTSAKWEANRHLTRLPTNAFGKIVFQPSSGTWRKPAKYVRLSDDTPMDPVLQLMKHHWKVGEHVGLPELIISVVGNGRQLKFSAASKSQLFTRGLLKALQTTRGWLITDGLNVGVSLAVGQILQKAQSLRWSYTEDRHVSVHDTFVCIGVAPWANVEGSEKLVNKANDQLMSADYIIGQLCHRGHSVSLNPDHTHFLLVDDGYRIADKYSIGYSTFRARLHQHMQKPVHDGGFGVPLVVVLIEGGLGSLWQALVSAAAGINVLACDKSGRAADILADTKKRYDKIMENHPDPSADRDSMLANLKSHVENELNGMTDPNLEWRIPVTMEKMADTMIEACEKQVIDTFTMDSDSDMDLVMIKLLIKTKRLDLLKQLQLTIQWNRADLAEDLVIYNHDFNLKKEDLFPLLHRVLVDDQPDFVRLFIEHGFAIAEFLDEQELLNLYRETVHGDHYLWPLLGLTDSHTDQSLQLSHIANFCKRIAKRTAFVGYGGSECARCYEQPFRELFFWAVLLNRSAMSMLFWTHVSEPLSVALAGTLMCHKLAYRIDSDIFVVDDSLRQMKSDFEAVAVKLIDTAFQSDPTKATFIIYRPINEFNNIQGVELARFANNQDFIATACVQQAIFRKWKSDMDISIYRLLFCNFLVLPIFWLHFPNNNLGLYAKFGAHKSYLRSLSSEKKMSKQLPNLLLPQIETNAAKSTRLGPYRKLKRFYNAPAVKFTNHMTFYLAYLLLYSYTIMFEYHETYVSAPETLLYVWQAAYTIELIRTFITMPSHGIIGKATDFTKHFLLKVETVAVIMSIIAFVTRFFSDLFPVARLLMCITLFPYCVLTFKLHMSNSYLGPKVMAIKRLIWDLGMFIMVILVFFVSYTVASAALVNAAQPFHWGVLWTGFQRGVWDIFGELNDDATTGAVPGCEDPNSSFDCMLRSYPIPILLTIYLCFGNILLINMLIAVFTNAFDEAQRNGETIWKYQMYYLLVEFNENKPVLPAPFILITHAWRLMQWMSRIVCCKSAGPRDRPKTTTKVFGCKLSQREIEYLRVFEQLCRGDMLNRERQQAAREHDKVLETIESTLANFVESAEDAAAEAKLDPKAIRRHQRQMEYHRTTSTASITGNF